MEVRSVQRVKQEDACFSNADFSFYYLLLFMKRTCCISSSESNLFHFSLLSPLVNTYYFEGILYNFHQILRFTFVNFKFCDVTLLFLYSL